MYDALIVGSGFAGAVTAREMAERGGQKVLVIEKRDHIGGNCFDTNDEYGIMIHQYGPHIFHTDEKRVFDYLSRFTDWFDYSHEVAGNINGKIIPIPFNLNTLYLVYGEERGDVLKAKLVEAYGMDSRVTILQLRENQDPDIKSIADYVYENIFLKYTMKQWGKTPEEVDPGVTNRVPILISYDNRYFQDSYQKMPKDGFTAIFKNILDHENITVKLNTDAKNLIEIKRNSKGTGKIYYEGKPFNGRVIFTGLVDEFFGCQYGRLPYRSLRFEMEHYNQEYYQTHGVVNYTVSEDFTRITEYKYLTGQIADDTTIMKEFPFAYSGEEGEIPYYSIANEENQNLYEQYKKAADVPDFYLLGRLAEYKYYNIETIILKALDLSDQILSLI